MKLKLKKKSSQLSFDNTPSITLAESFITSIVNCEGVKVKTNVLKFEKNLVRQGNAALVLVLEQVLVLGLYIHFLPLFHTPIPPVE